MEPKGLAVRYCGYAALGVNAKALEGASVDEKALSRTEAIILSMTPRERDNPSLLNNSRKKRIAAGSGTQVVGTI